MKKYRILLFLIGLFILIPIVKADDDFMEYGLIYNPLPSTTEYPHGIHILNNNLKDICDELPEGVSKSDIFTFDESTMTLTLKEGIHYVGIYSPVSITITSNNKQVYVNIFNSEQILNIVNVKSNSFNTSGTTALLTEDTIMSSTATRLYTHIHGQEINITGSTVIFNNYDNDMIQNNIHTITYENGIISTDEQVGSGNITITNSTVETPSAMYSLDGKDIIISNSNVKAFGIGSYGNNSNSDITITSSSVSLESDKIYEYNGNYGTLLTAPGTLTLTNSSVTSNGTIQSNNILMNNSHVYGTTTHKQYYFPAFNVNELSLEDSSIDVLGNIVAVSITMDNSTLIAESGSSEELKAAINRDFGGASTLITRSLSLTDSEFRVSSNGVVPSLIIVDTFSSNKDNHVIINDSYVIEEFKKVNLSDYGFTPANSYNSIILGAMSVTQGYTALINDTPVYQVTTAHTKEVTLKIQNGTWEDGTTDDKIVTIIDGLKPDKNEFKSTSSIENGILTIKETGDNEYTFIYSEKKEEANPKTGVRSFIVLLLISFIGVMLLNNYRDKLSFFKKL